MSISKHHVILGGIGLAVVALLLGARVVPVIAGRVQFSGNTDSFRYTGQGNGNRGVYLVVSVDMDNPVALQKYQEANVRRGWQLVAQKPDQPVPVQITFNRPIPVADVREWVQQTDFQVTSFLLVGYSTISQQRGTHVQFGSLDTDVPEREVMDPATGDELVFNGIMVLQGRVKASQDGLGKWLSNPEVYLVDTSEVEVRALAASRHAMETANKDINVSLPSPFWKLDW